jgi:hypothetical protein
LAFTTPHIETYLAQTDTISREVIRPRKYAKTVIMHFEGVLGDIVKKNMIDDSPPGLYLRPDVVGGL